MMRMGSGTNWTLPNVLSILRACGIPLFFYLALVTHQDGWAVLLLALGGASDYFDGKIARAWGQESSLGAMLDPAVDRLYIVSTLVVLYMRDVIPLWLIATLVIRDILLALLALVLKGKGYGLLTVTFLGKAATFTLLYAFPFLLLGLAKTTFGSVAYVVGWSFAIWGVALYVYTGMSYFRIGLRRIRVGSSFEVLE